MQATGQQRRRSHAWKAAGFVITTALGLLATGIATAQSTGGAIFGQAPAGSTVILKGSMGANRRIVVKDSGRYRIDGLRLGTYTVTLQTDGKDTDKRTNIPLTVGRAAEVDFACPNDVCAKP